MENIREYRAAAGWDENCEEVILIGQYSKGGNEKYYIRYGVFTDGLNCPCYAGEFETLEKAEAALYKHRPKARKI